jgi:hypothetical protein
MIEYSFCRYNIGEEFFVSYFGINKEQLYGCIYKTDLDNELNEEALIIQKKLSQLIAYPLLKLTKGNMSIEEKRNVANKLDEYYRLKRIQRIKSQLRLEAL